MELMKRKKEPSTKLMVEDSLGFQLSFSVMIIFMTMNVYINYTDIAQRSNAIPQEQTLKV